MGSSGGILARYAVVLEALAASPGGLSLTELAQATALPRGTVHRLIAALVGVGYIAGRDGRKVYVLGPRLLRLLHMGVAPIAVAPLAQPILESLAKRFGETAFVAKLVGADVKSVAMVVPDSEIESYVQPGRIMPIHAAASAKAIWAFQDDEALDEAISRPHHRFTDTTRVEIAEIRADLERVARQGFAFCDEELDPGVLSYACPVHLEDAGVIYSIGMVGLTQRLERHSPTDIVTALGDAASQLSSRLPSGLKRAAIAEVPSRRLDRTEG